MATISISTVTACTNGEHIKITGTVDGVSKSLYATTSELIDAVKDVELKDKFVLRAYFRFLDENANTPAKRKLALEGWTCKV